MKHPLDDTPSPFADRLEEVLVRYLKARDAGQPVDRAGLVAAHPDLAGLLEAYFADEDSFTALLAHQPDGPPAEEPAALGSVGEYELLAEISRGGMGVVYRARQRRLRREVALKVIREGRFAGPLERARFRTEVESAAQLDHPHIVPIYEVGDQGEQPFFSMKLIEGGSLEDQMKALAAGGLDGQRRAATLVAKLARAVHHAHQRGILHRDLKPRNILLDKAGEPLVTDFGLAKRLGMAGQTHSGAIMGTPEYMAPEQARGEKGPTTAVDVHGLGAIFYALLTGKPPFHGETVAEALRQAMDQEPLPPRKRQPGVNADLETICMKCLAKEPGKRYLTALELAEDLERFQAGKPILARPAGALERGWKWVKRRPALAGLIVVSALAMVTLLGGGVFFTMKAQAAEAKANADKDQALAVVMLLESAFLGLDPTREAKGGLDLKTQLLHNLEQMAVEIEKKYGGDPRVRAALRNALGIAEQGLGEPGKALDLFLAARIDFEKLGGPDHPDTLNSKNNLAGAYQAVGKLDQAVKLFEETLEKRKKTLGPDHPDTLGSMNNLAGAYHRIGRLDLAVPLSERTLEKREKVLGPDHPDTLSTMNNLASAYRYDGKLDKALLLYKETLDRTKAKLGPDHPLTLICMSNQADTYVVAGQPKEAVRVLEDVLQKRKKKLGFDHPDTLLSMNNLAGAYQAVGKLYKAVELFEETLERRQAKLGPDHPDTISSMDNLAGAYQAASKLDKALPLYKEALEKAKAKLAPDHPATLNLMNNLAGAYQMAGKLNLAVPLFEATLKKRQEKLGPDHPATLSSMDNLAGAYQAAGQLDKALQLYEQTLEKMKARFAPNHPARLNSTGNLARAYLMTKQPAKAMPRFREFLAGQRELLKADEPRLAGLLAVVAQDFLKYDQAAEAETLLRECLTIREKKEPEAWTTFNTRSMLGGALLGQKKAAEAEPFLLQGCKGMMAREKDIPPASRHHLTNAVQHIVQLYEATDQPEEAAEWRKKLPPAKKGPQP